jgi:hypothetical protein
LLALCDLLLLVSSAADARETDRERDRTCNDKDYPQTREIKGYLKVKINQSKN